MNVITKANEQSGTGTRPKRLPRWLVWAGGSVLVLLVIAAVVVTYILRNAEPILRKRVIASLEDRFRSPVELEALHISLLRGLEVSGSGLRVRYFGENNLPGSRADDVAPMLVVKSFEFHTGLHELFQPVMRVSLVKVQGMQLRIPPKEERGPMLPGKTQQVPEEKEEVKPKRSIVLDKIVVSDMTLTIETNKPGKLPLVFDIRNVTLHDAGAGRAFPFDASLVNPKPLGNIHSTGQFGPWRGDNPRDTPVNGSYSFTHADLGTIKGISGMLSSTGKYSGTLGEIGVTGTTETPDFALDVSEHPVDLRTEFDATVDGTTGDTRLNSVHATLLHTILEVNGEVIRESNMPGEANPQGKGHLIDLSVASDHARVEDILTLAAKSRPALMHGALTLRAQLSIPPGHVSVSRKMHVQGTFGIHDATLNRPSWQQTVDKLSERASGNPEHANAADAARVASDADGSFMLANAVVDVPKLTYQLPGAQVALSGKYSLDGKTFDFTGTVRTKATASQMLTGWKSIVAMPLDPLLKKKGAGLQVPITINGTESAPKLGLNLGKLGDQILHRKQSQEAPAQKP
jgi:hypothetical protein